MSDEQLEQTVQNDGVGNETPMENAEPVISADPVVEKAVEEPAAKPELTLQEKIAAKKEAADAKVVTPGEKAPEAGAFTPNYKFKVLDKEHEIPKEFQALVKDAKTEKMVKEIFEKSYGLDSVKEKAVQVRTERDTLAKENREIQAGIASARASYLGAVQSGNWLKLDDFFAKLHIPQEHVLQYALAKVNLTNLPEDQQKVIVGQLEADRRAEFADQQAREAQGQVQSTGQQLKQLQFDFTMAKPETKSFAEQFDAQVGKPGAFAQRVIDTAQLEWHTRKVDLTPEQAVQKVIADFGLKPGAPAAPAAAAAPAAPAPGAPEKRVIQRQAPTIPNVQGRSSSPLSTKPKSIEDLKKLRDAAMAR